MSNPYDPKLVAIAQETAQAASIPLQSGTYVAVTGPTLETRAETRMLQMLGGDAVGMSTVPEVIVATSVGMRIMALAAITNVNLPDAMEPVSIEMVIQTAEMAAPKMALIIEGVVGRFV